MHLTVVLHTQWAVMREVQTLDVSLQCVPLSAELPDKSQSLPRRFRPHLVQHWLMIDRLIQACEPPPNQACDESSPLMPPHPPATPPPPPPPPPASPAAAVADVSPDRQYTSISCRSCSAQVRLADTEHGRTPPPLPDHRAPLPTAEQAPPSCCAAAAWLCPCVGVAVCG